MAIDKFPRRSEAVSYRWKQYPRRRFGGYSDDLSFGKSRDPHASFLPIASISTTYHPQGLTKEGENGGGEIMDHFIEP